MDVLATVITAVLTVVSPLAIAWAKRESWTKLVKVAVPIVVSIAIAWGYLAYTGGIVHTDDMIKTILAVYGAQQLAYTTILRWWATILEQVGNKPAPVTSEITIPRAQLEGWHNTPPLTGSDWRKFAESLPASQEATALLSVADALDRTPGPDHRA